MNTKMEIKTTTCAAVLLLSAGLAAGCKDGTAPREAPAVSATTLHAEVCPAGEILSFSGAAEGAGGTTQSFMSCTLAAIITYRNSSGRRHQVNCGAAYRS